ncbi:transcriptional regulator [Desulfuribacillus stibiiarsenatis]|uniref:Transcriptional regulator n=1 Tax=Desulfuribacillus stibiiarsenatis TaxID=1390249 RepID=A0A1E5L7E5_9FIRM|nr:WYL domain-containing protein [Desulfuribacillus stibiiarsenatis]OEH86082.1 transcriptional regulator [Desulfuribacillus stibiiarsenatis]
MKEQLIRLLKIITLVQSKPGIRSKELAVRCETTERTIFRDLDYLSAAHIPITCEGYGKGYRYNSNFSLYPLDWTDDETLAFALLHSIILDMKDNTPALLNAYDKVMATAYKEKQAKSIDLAKRINTLFYMGRSTSSDTKTMYLEDIVQAILENKQIETIYHTQSRDETTTRTIDPYYLVPREHRFYLIGYCHRAKGIRTFRVSRFKRLNVLPTTYQMNNFDLHAYLKNTWSIERGEESIHFKIRFSLDVARYILEEELFVIPKITKQSDGSIIFQITVNSAREFLQWLNQYGPDAQIFEPAYYREKQKESLRKWLNLYEI